MDKNKFFRSPSVVVLGALLCCFLWGSAFPCIKIGYELFGIDGKDTGTQILFGGLRFVLAGFFTIILGSVLQRKILRLTKENWSKACKLSTMQTIGQYVLFYIGLAHTSGVRASIVEGTNVFVAILVASLIFKQEKLTTRKIIGSMLGFIGVVIVNLSGKATLKGSFWSGDLLVFASTFCYAFSSVLLKNYSKTEDPVTLSGYQFMLGGVAMIAIGFALGGGGLVITGAGIGMLVYLAMVSAVAYTLWGVLLKYNPISRVAVIGFMNPVFGVILSGILLKENSAFGPMAVASLLLISVGIYIVNAKEKIK